MKMSWKIVPPILLGIVVVGAILWGKWAFEERAPDPLHTIFLAQIEYSREHPEEGFASSFEDLNPLIDSVLASGAKSGYEFILWTGAPDSHGRVTRFFVVARPKKYHEGARSLFIDESGVERFTTENRSAMVTDPPVH
jgi:hypothetical protein